MGKKSDAPPPPDYSGVAAASAQAAQDQYMLGRQQLNFERKQDQLNRTLNNQVVSRLMADDDRATQWASEDRARYMRDYAPIEDQYAATVQNWDSPARENEQAGLAAGTVANQFAGARHAAVDELEAYGIDPSQTRYAALDLGSRLAEAATSAGAQNNARMQTQLQGVQLQQNAVSMGRGLPAQALAEQNSGAGNSSQALSGQLNTTNTGANAMGTPTQWNSLGNQAVGTWGNILHQSYQDQLGGFEANQQASSGTGALLGSALGMGLGAFYGGNNSIFNGLKNAFATGGAVPPPVGYHPQGAIPLQASPTGGQTVDDVPAQLTAGEFVVPRDVALWEGEKGLQAMIMKARKERANAATPGAPRQGVPQPQAPQQPAPRSALPMR